MNFLNWIYSFSDHREGGGPLIKVTGMPQKGWVNSLCSRVTRKERPRVYLVLGYLRKKKSPHAYRLCYCLLLGSKKTWVIAVPIVWESPSRFWSITSQRRHKLYFVNYLINVPSIKTKTLRKYRWRQADSMSQWPVGSCSVQAHVKIFIFTSKSLGCVYLH